MMSPCTSFTKIWRMRNNGTLVWARGTQLLWIDGDRFSPTVRVELEVPPCGVPPNGELNVAVDFTAPQLPGRYISYWRMASPLGVKFGQRVWVLIEVQDLASDFLRDTVPNFLGLNLNASPISLMPNDFGGIDITLQPTLDDLSRECHRSSNRYTQPAKSADDEQLTEEELNAFKNYCMPDAYPFGPQHAPSSSFVSYRMPEYPLAPQQAPSSSSVSYRMPEYPLAPQQAPSSSSISHPISDLKEKALAETSNPSPSVKGVPLSLDDVGKSLFKQLEDKCFNPSPSVTGVPLSSGDVEKSLLKQLEEICFSPSPSVTDEPLSSDDVEKTLLKELEEMGFKEIDLNKEILRTNGYNLEQSVDALCGVSEWDTILEELQEMGFCDKETNKMLLKKNNGSIKAVVMDLLSGKKA
ncbi:protein NBR1 homolog [Carica papaya]|uniref:protein NBR1 homolog n=1 Tax=Carica papaya TaxID=3649 RepID=UPI000B8CF281|nr:protein NBR1 homolog [Carica papaya]